MPRFTLAPQLLNNSAEVLAGGKLYFYETQTTTLKATYSDSAESIQNTNPVVLDSSGRVPDIFFSGSARVIIKTSNDVQLDDIDPIVNSFNNLGGSELTLDADLDTSITADTDDQIDIKIAGADDFQFTANTFTALSGSTIKTNAIAETTSGNGVVIDGNTLKDSVQYQAEIAAAIADVAGSGQWWVKNDTPNVPMFTNDAGTDFQLASLAGTETLTNKTLTTPTLTNPTLVLKQSATPTPTANGDLQWDSDNFKLVVGDGTDQQVIVTTEGITGDVTITTSGVSAIGSGVIVNADINASAAIDASKVHDGSVSNTEFGYLNGVTSAIQTQLDAKQATLGNNLDLLTSTEVGYLDGATAGSQVASKALVADASNQILFVGTRETIYAISDGASVALDPANGNWQTWTLGANRTPSWAGSNGEGLVLLINDGTAYTITWTDSSFNGGAGPTWLNNAGAAPTLATSGYTAVYLFEIGGVEYGLMLGDQT
jgi:hypothetical protein